MDVWSLFPALKWRLNHVIFIIVLTSSSVDRVFAQPGCGGVGDILFLVDDSEATLSLEGGNPTYPTGLTNFLLEAINFISIGDFRAGITLFSNTARRQIDFSNDIGLLQTAINTIVTDPRSLDTFVGIRDARTQFQNARPDAKKLLLLITNGISSNYTMTTAEAIAARREEIGIIGVSFHGAVPEPELELITGDINLVISSPDADSLVNIYPNLVSVACSFFPITTTASPGTSDTASTSVPDLTTTTDKSTNDATTSDDLSSRNSITTVDSTFNPMTTSITTSFVTSSFTEDTSPTRTTDSTNSDVTTSDNEETTVISTSPSESPTTSLNEDTSETGFTTPSKTTTPALTSESGTSDTASTSVPDLTTTTDKSTNDATTSDDLSSRNSITTVDSTFNPMTTSITTSFVTSSFTEDTSPARTTDSTISDVTTSDNEETTVISTSPSESPTTTLNEDTSETGFTTPSKTTTPALTSESTTSDNGATTTASPCNSPADILLLVDDSDSLQRLNEDGTAAVYSPAVVSFVKSLNSLVTNGNKRIAITMFSATTRAIATFEAEKTPLDNAIDTFTPEFSGTNGQDVFLQPVDLFTNTARAEVAKHIIFIIDSVTDNPTATSASATTAKAAGIDVISVGFSDAVSMSELTNVASSSSQVFTVNSDTDLSSITSSVANLVC